MNKLKNLALAGLMALGTVAASAGTAAQAGSQYPKYTGAALVKIRSDGFKRCKALGDSGYTAFVRGTENSGGGINSGPRGFFIRSCFETRAQCEHFLTRIPHIVRALEELRYTNCKARD